MKQKRTQPAIAAFAFLAWALALPAFAQEADLVRVTVRFAKVRALPQPAARVVKEIGFGTILRMLAASGEYFRVAPLGAAPAPETWYILRSEVEPAPAAAAPALPEGRRVTFTPADPAPGRQLLFTASGFRTPNLLKWDMGDGTTLTSGGRPGAGGEAVLAYSYSAPGTYLVKVFDKGGADSLPPVTVSVAVSASSKLPSSVPEQAKQPDAPAALPDADAAKPLVSVSDKVQALADPVVEPVVASVAPMASPPRRRPRKYPIVKLGPYAGYFRPTDALVKEIYSEGDALYGGRLGVRIWKGFYLWLSLSQFKSIGRTTFTEDKTTLTLMPASAFLRFEIGQGFFIPYIGVGYTMLSFKEESENVGGIVDDQAGNTSAEAGFEFKLNRHVYIDLGARFDMIEYTPDTTKEKIDLGGLQAGISLLISF